MSREPGALRVFFFLFLTYAQFFQNASWGSASRFDLARALAEHRTIRIDAYHENTGDKAIANGHTYTDKAPCHRSWPCRESFSRTPFAM
jgi:hypothetical protein